MNDKDRKILEILKENCKLSTQQISKKTGVPITTVYNRIKKLERDGVIKNYTVILDNKKLGKNITAYVFLSTQHFIDEKYRHEVIDKLNKHPDVEFVHTLTGNHDVILRVNVSDVDELDKFLTWDLKKFGGITGTQTMVVLYKAKEFSKLL